jgi:hypothetical protein
MGFEEKLSKDKEKTLTISSSSSLFKTCNVNIRGDKEEF